MRIGQATNDVHQLGLARRFLGRLQVDLGDLEAVGIDDDQDDDDQKGADRVPDGALEDCYRVVCFGANCAVALFACPALLYVTDAFGFFAVDVFEALVVNFVGQSLKNQFAVFEGDHPVGIALDQVQEVQAAEDGDAVFLVDLLQVLA